MDSVVVCDKWLDYYKNEVSDITYKRYCSTVIQYIKPFIKRNSIINLTADNINEFLNDMRKKNVEPTVMSRIRHSFVMIIKFAKRCGYKIDIDTNMIKLPKVEEYETTITQSQAKMIYNYCIGKTDYLSIAILLSMFTGIRISEICALKISDIEINEHTIHVYKTIQKNKNGKLEIAEVSALSNKRDVIIPDILYNYLKIYLSGHNEEVYFISNRKNGFCSTRVLQKKLQELSNQLGFYFNFNYLRNYFFHVCMRSNMNIYTLMDLYGLSQMKVTFGEENRQSMKKKFDEVQKIGWFN